MAFDIKGKVNEIMDKVSKDKDLKDKFMKDPIKTVEGILGVDLPDEAVKKVIGEVTEKLSAGKGEAAEMAGEAREKAEGLVEKAGDALKKLF